MILEIVVSALCILCIRVSSVFQSSVCVSQSIATSAVARIFAFISVFLFISSPCRLDWVEPSDKLDNSCLPLMGADDNLAVSVDARQPNAQCTYCPQRNVDLAKVQATVVA
jgi:hypothetical protein